VLAGPLPRGERSVNVVMASPIPRRDARISRTDP
jgi:hypothetical protein